MLGVIKILEKLINSFNKETLINILVLTDGMIHDKNDTEEQLKIILIKKKININI